LLAEAGTERPSITPILSDSLKGFPDHGGELITAFCWGNSPLNIHEKVYLRLPARVAANLYGSRATFAKEKEYES
jgi:hypothetical protein